MREAPNHNDANYGNSDQHKPIGASFLERISTFHTCNYSLEGVRDYCKNV